MNKKLRDFKTASDRRKALEVSKSKAFSAIGSTILKDYDFTGHCENAIGATQIPLGIAGPLNIKDQSRVEKYFLPLATTEGALVASINRGCKAIAVSGGVAGHVYRAGVTRGPVFLTDSIEGNKKFYHWLKDHEDVLKQQARETSGHLVLKKMVIRTVGRYSFVRFSFDTADAMGMNMVTIAVAKMAQFIEKEMKVQCVSVAGNFDIDKKPAWLNFIENRGFKVWAEVVLSPQALKTVLKTTPEKMFKLWLSKCVYGSIMSGSLGFNAQFANVVAAIFIATGQDPAHVVEGSMGVTTTEILSSGDLYVSIYLPALLVGTVGGGTLLPTQKEALEILGLYGSGNVEEFAQVIGGAVLAGEISLLASLAEGSLANVHARFRKKS